MRLKSLALWGAASVILAGCSQSKPPDTLLDGAMVDRKLTLTHAHHYTLLELDYGTHAEQARPGQLNKVQRCRAQLKLVVTSAKSACGSSPVNSTTGHYLTITMDLTSSDPARADVSNVVFDSGGRAFWGEGTMLLNSRASASVPQGVRCNPAPHVRVPGALSGHMILSFYADRQRGGERLGWLEGGFTSRGCGQKSDTVASIEQE